MVSWPQAKLRDLPQEIQAKILGYDDDLASLHTAMSSCQVLRDIQSICGEDKVLASILDDTLDRRILKLALLHYDIIHTAWYSNPNVNCIYDMFCQYRPSRGYLHGRSEEQARDMLRFYDHVEFFVDQFCSSGIKNFKQKYHDYGDLPRMKTECLRIARALYLHDILLQAMLTKNADINLEINTVEDALKFFMSQWTSLDRQQIWTINDYLHPESKYRSLDAYIFVENHPMVGGDPIILAFTEEDPAEYLTGYGLAFKRTLLSLDEGGRFDAQASARGEIWEACGTRLMRILENDFERDGSNLTEDLHDTSFPENNDGSQELWDWVRRGVGFSLWAFRRTLGRSKYGIMMWSKRRLQRTLLLQDQPGYAELVNNDLAAEVFQTAD
ncbi:hypothetical protein BO78DRAFT_443041 [Aspergillus sclerotiicarbonarius CBS 121057]|uniref:Uncharacterized protein n=1 Tax=Aspergillus sclerotiicarbonarius (strain CBS 121057 / IBT 28362) TaxID=1448318 RepID=A0A319ECV0_ASPSB|nr:hypothetical protein BO78DRAFT_443041 [Aspergillus sclerotiicarbonarius CBS 121057]